MIREALKKHHGGANKEFRPRGENPGRIENFSDAVFALAITLLLISTSPPSNFEQIKSFAWNVIPFVLCISLIVLTWYEHFTFFYRYGLRHGRVIVLNSLFLIIVLFYVYPLKFLTKMILVPIAYFTGNEKLLNDFKGVIKGEDWSDLMIIYGLGAASISFVLMLMYRHALKNAEDLELNEIEIFDTRTSIRTNFLMGIIPLISVFMAFMFRGQWIAGMVSGFTYFLYTPVMMIHGKKVDRDRSKLLHVLSQEKEVIEDTAIV
jgi:uncharacterized membrane protein